MHKMRTCNLSNVCSASAHLKLLRNYIVKNIQLKITTIKFVSLSNQGFFLVEMLVTVFVFSAITLLLSNLFILGITSVTSSQNYNRVIQISNSMNSDFLNGNQVEINPEEITIDTYDCQIEYKLKNGYLIRQQNNQGFERIASVDNQSYFFTENNLIYLKTNNGYNRELKILLWNDY